MRGLGSCAWPPPARAKMIACAPPDARHYRNGVGVRRLQGRHNGSFGSLCNVSVPAAFDMVGGPWTVGGARRSCGGAAARQDVGDHERGGADAGPKPVGLARPAACRARRLRGSDGGSGLARRSGARARPNRGRGAGAGRGRRRARECASGSSRRYSLLVLAAPDGAPFHGSYSQNWFARDGARRAGSSDGPLSGRAPWEQELQPPAPALAQWTFAAGLWNDGTTSLVVRILDHGPR